MKLHNTLRTRIVMLVVAAVVPMFGLSIFNAWLNQDAAIRRATDNLQTSAAMVAASQDQVAASASQILAAIANAPGLLEDNTAACPHFLKTLKDAFPVYSSLGIIGLDGHYRCYGLGSSSPAVFVGDRGYFQQALTHRGIVADGYVMSRMTGKPIVTFAMPVMDRVGKIKAVAVVGVDLSEIAKTVANVPLPQGGHIVITDRQGIVLVGKTTTRNIPMVGQQVPSLTLQEAVRTMRTGVGEGSDDSGLRQIYAFLPNGSAADSPFFVAVSANRDSVVAPARTQMGRELMTLTLVAFLGGSIAWLVGGRAIVKPAAQIIDAIEQLQKGALDVHIPARLLDGRDEFARIASGFNRMAESLQSHRDAQQAAQAQSHAIQQKLQDAQRLGRIGYWQVDLDSQQLWWSDEVYELLGVDRTSFDCTCDGMHQLIHPDDRMAFEAYRHTAIQTGLASSIEFRTITPAGEVRWMHQSFGILLDAKDEPTRSRSGVLQDITERHESQAHLHLLETCISRLNDVVVILDTTGPDEGGPRILFVNEAFTQQKGYAREEVMGKSIYLLHGPKTRGAAMNQLISAGKNNESVRTELIHYTKSGAEVWVELSVDPIFDAKGEVTQWVSVERNITQRKLSEQALIESEQRYAALFESAPVPMWVFDSESYRFLAVNDAAVQCYGYSRAEFLSMTIFDIRSKALAAALKAQWAITPLVMPERWEHRRKDGSLFFSHPYAKPIQYAGRPARLVLALDISPQVKVENDAKAYLFTLQRAADAAQAISWHHTLQGTLQEVVDQSRGVIGTHLAMVSLVLDGDWTRAIHASSLDEKYNNVCSEQPDGTGIYALVCENNRPMRLTQSALEAHPRWRGIATKDSEHPAINGWLAVPLMGRNGKNIGLLQLSDKYEGEFTQQDEYIAIELAQLASAALENSLLLVEVHLLNTGLEQKVAERTAALARQEALFHALAEQAPQVVWTADPNGKVTYGNRAWFDLVGGELKDWTGSRWLCAIHPEDLPAVKAGWQVSLASLSPFKGIRRVRAKDGRYHTMAYRASPVLDDQGKVAFWVGIDADITEFKAIEAALRVSNQELETFSYTVSHDLRSPLNAINGFSHLLARLLAPQLTGDSGEKAKHYLSRIQSGVVQMGHLIESLLTLAEVSRVQLHSEAVDLSGLARGILGGWQERQPERHVSIQIETGLLTHCDWSLISVVMENLLANAWKFSANQPQAEISVGQKLDAAGLPVFFVRDNGAGFDMAYADKLFVPFQRLHGVTEFPGTGIGLATASRAIKRYGGRLWAESAPGCGATFFFTLPHQPVVL
ncbi:MAG: PAS domain S-box protein [Polaromonas sp.]